MEKEQEREWAEAQKITFGIDLVAATQKQLKFLAVIDCNRQLYEGPALQWAIFRYNTFWIPLLAKHSENPLSEEPLVVPLDCEWIWHCHRLNPVQYKLDCEKLYGRILGNENVISSVKGTPKNKTEEIWKTMYPQEPYELEMNRNFSNDILPGNSHDETFTSYDLVSAVTRQISFFFQVSRPHMSCDLFLQEAVARYKGFMHLMRTNRKKNIRLFCVPTYDVDLIWHSHQLHPHSYCEDLITIVGELVGHDDTVSDRTKGKKLDKGFSETTQQWEKTFGLRYWKAGGMYRGPPPTPVTHIPFRYSVEGENFYPTSKYENKTHFHDMEAVEVLLEFVEIKNLPKDNNGKIFVSFSKKQPDKLFNTKRTLSIFSESGDKQVASFECEPTGEFLFELVSHLPSNIPKPKSFKLIGSCSLSLQELLASKVQLSFDKWLSVVPISSTENSQPTLHVSISFTIPTPTLQVYHLVQPPKSCKCLHANNWTRVIDDDGNEVISLQVRNLSKEIKNAPEVLKEVHYITKSGERHTLARLVGNEWCITDTYGSFRLRISSGNNGDLFELVGDKMVRVFPGRRLEYEPTQHEKQRSEQDFFTAVDFSTAHPYGKAVALFDFKSGTFKVNDEWMVLPGITLTFVLLKTLGRKGYTALTRENNLKEVIDQVVNVVEIKGCSSDNDGTNCSTDCGIKTEAFNGNCGVGCGIKKKLCTNDYGRADCGAGCGIKSESLNGDSGLSNRAVGCEIKGAMCTGDYASADCSASCEIKSKAFNGDCGVGNRVVSSGIEGGMCTGDYSGAGCGIKSEALDGDSGVGNYGVGCVIKGGMCTGDHGGADCGAGCGIKSEAGGMCTGDHGGADCGAGCGIKSEALDGDSGVGNYGVGCVIKGGMCTGDHGGADCGAGCGIKSEALDGDSGVGNYGVGCVIKGGMCTGDHGGADCGAGCGIKSEALDGDSGVGNYGVGCVIKGGMCTGDHGGADCGAGCGIKSEAFNGDCGGGDCGAGCGIKDGVLNSDYGNGNCGIGNVNALCRAIPDSSMVNESIAC